MRIWLAIVVGAGVFIASLWYTHLPLGIPDEWTWERQASEPDFSWNLVGGAVAAGLFITFVMQGWQRLTVSSSHPGRCPSVLPWLAGMVLASFAWIWIVQEVAPIQNRLGKAAFVLYYPSSSGYFTRARYDEPDARALLAGYETLMQEQEVFHTGTHPPGLFLVFHALIAVCDASPELSRLLDVTQPGSFREACDVIATNGRRRSNPRPLFPLDRRVLWLATLLVMASASLAVIPLYGLLRRGVSVPTAWTCIALWPAMPAVSVFIPKSDVVFPLIGLTVLWIWLTAWDRRSLVLALLTGFVTWCGVMCSLAFLPVLLAAAILTFGLAWITPIPTQSPTSSDSMQSSRRAFCLAAALLGFALPTFLLWRYKHVNMLNVWWMNYRNHARFYELFHRTYWKWLLVNPLETSFAAGWPITLLAIVTCCVAIRGYRRQSTSSLPLNVVGLVGSLGIVWGLLWLTGKNSGEVARLWILFLPWLIWLASFQWESMASKNQSNTVLRMQVIALLAIQFAVCLLTVARVGGFHNDVSVL